MQAKARIMTNLDCNDNTENSAYIEKILSKSVCQDFHFILILRNFINFQPSIVMQMSCAD